MIKKEIDRAATKDRQTLRTYNEKTRDNRIPLVMTYDNRLPRVKEAIDNSWGILQINENESRKFSEKPRLCYRRNKNLRDIIGQTKLTNGKVVRTKLGERTGRCSPCRGRGDAMCCAHVVNTTFFTDRTGRKRFEIRQKTNCRSKNAITWHGAIVARMVSSILVSWNHSRPIEG